MFAEKLRLSEDQLRCYQSDGIICLRNIFTTEWIESLREAAEQSMQQPGELHAELAKAQDHEGRFFHDTFMWRHQQICKRFVFESVAAKIAQQCMDSNKINIFFDQWLIKEPGTPTQTPWHHDMTYWPIDGFQVCTIWVALDAITPETGSVEYIKGSHQWGEKYRAVSFSGNSQYTEPLPEIPDIESMRNELEIAQFDMQPGDCTVHHGLLVHGSPGNQSIDMRRRAYVTRWLGDDVTFHPREGLQEMPPLPELKPGDPVDSQLWPRIL